MKRKILAPGIHTYDGGGQQRVGTEQFCASVLEAMPEGIIYRKGGVIGEIRSGDFFPITGSQMRLVVDTYTEIEAHAYKQKTQHVQYLPCSTELGQAVLDHAGAIPAHFTPGWLGRTQSPAVRALRCIAPHPVFTQAGKILGPGWHPWYGILVTWDGLPADPIDPTELLADFGLDPISRANAIALMLTVLVRPALNGNVPLFVVTAPVPGAGKTKLIDEVVGSITLGRAVPSMVWPSDPEEIRKTLTAAMMSGSQFLNIDNVPRILDSEALASFLTTSSWRDRILGRSSSIELPNTITLAATGNQVQASGELARRSVRIEIKPGCDNPEMRRGPGLSRWRFDDLRAAALERRDGIVAWLTQLFQNWVDAGRPESGLSLGSFEGWVRAVVGPLAHAGLPVIQDVHSAATALDAERFDVERVFSEWWDMHRDVPVFPKDVLAIADRVEAWRALIASRNNERGQVTVVGIKLSRLVGRVVGQFRLEEVRSRLGRTYRLVTVANP